MSDLMDLTEYYDWRRDESAASEGDDRCMRCDCVLKGEWKGIDGMDFCDPCAEKTEKRDY